MKRKSITKQRYVVCPICKKGKIIMKDGNDEDMPFRLVLPGSKRKVHWYIKCEVCKNQIGITVKE